MKTTKELEQLIKMLKKQGVYQFKDGELELKITPTPVDIPVKLKEVTEDDLYYSAGTAKPRKIK